LRILSEKYRVMKIIIDAAERTTAAFTMKFWRIKPEERNIV